MIKKLFSTGSNLFYDYNDKLTEEKIYNIVKKKKKKKNENKKDILNIIIQNIEKGNMNLNNPDLFSSEIFTKFMNDDMSKTYDKNNNLIL